MSARQGATMESPQRVPRFQVGGALHEDSIYVPRPWDQELYQLLYVGTPCHVIGPRQSGKSSLALRVARRLQAAGYLCTFTDLSSIGTTGMADISNWYVAILTSLIRPLGIRDLDVAAMWDALPHASFEQRCLSVLSTSIKSLADQKIVCFIDEIDTVLSLRVNTISEYGHNHRQRVDAFFHCIRSIINGRTRHPQWQHLNFCFLGVASSTELVDTSSAPFNIMTEVRLGDFSEEEAAGEFAAAMSFFVDDPRARVNEILSWTSGHPYMTHRICEQTARHPDESVAELVNRLFLHSGRTDDPNLAAAERRLDHVSSEFGTDELPRLYRRILTEEALLRDLSSRVQHELYLCGLIRFDRNTGQPMVRNRIYAYVFNDEWALSKEEHNKLHGFLATHLDRWLMTSRSSLCLLPKSLLADASRWAEVLPNDSEVQAFVRASQEAALAAEHTRAALVEKKQLIRQRILLILLLLASIALTSIMLIWIRSEKNVRLLRERELLQEKKSSALSGQLALQEQFARKQSEQSAHAHLRMAEAERNSRIALEQRRQLELREIVSLQSKEQILIQLNTLAEQRALETERRAAAERSLVETKIRMLADKTHHAQEAEQRSRRDAYIWELRGLAAGVKQDAARQSINKSTILAAIVVVDAAIRLACGEQQPMLAADSERLSRDLQWAAWEVQSVTQSLLSRTFYHSRAVSRVAFSSDGSRFAFGDQEGQIGIIDVASLHVVSWFTSHSHAIRGLRFSRDDRWLVSVARDGSAVQWDTRTGTQQEQIRMSDRGISRLDSAISTDLRYVATVGPGRLHLFDRIAGETKSMKTDIFRELPYPTGFSAALSPDSRRMIAGRGDGTVRVFDASTGQQLMVLGHPQEENNPMALAIAVSGEWLASGHYGGTIYRWRLSDGQPLGTPSAGLGRIQTLAISQDDLLIAAGNESGEVIVLLTDGGIPIFRERTNQKGRVSSMAFSPREFGLLLAAAEDSSIRLYPMSRTAYLRAACTYVSSENLTDVAMGNRVAGICSAVPQTDCHNVGTL